MSVVDFAPARQAAWPLGSRPFQAAGASVDLLFPAACALCGTRLTAARGVDDLMVCLPCSDALCATAETPCPRCARPLPTAFAGSPRECVPCQSRRWRFARTVALGVYEGRLREVVLQIKHSSGEAATLAVGGLLGELVAERLASHRPDCVVAMPTHWRRRLFRRHSCADVLAEAVARQMRLRVARRVLRCVRNTAKQGVLLPAERTRNIRGAYSASTGYGISGAHVLVVDDVMTTGATANETAKVLRRAGAAEVSIAVVARGVGFD